jgi:flavin reductase (DIM6/NTAB) family NADH-FMN oxidoreductase RutF
MTGKQFGVDGLVHRRLMGMWATGVSLVTTHSAGRPVGCTLNALTSLSLDPPSLLVSLQARSRTLEAVRETGLFAVNVLSASQEWVARRFADSSLGPDERFETVAYTEEDGVPVIARCLATFVCEVRETTSLYDHVLVVGRVIDGTVDDDKYPLVFFRGVYYGPEGDGDYAPSA